MGVRRVIALWHPFFYFPDKYRRTEDAKHIMRTKKILIVDDEPAVRELLKDALEPYGLRISLAEDGITALALAAREQPEMAFIDIRMPGMNGVQLLARLKQVVPELRAVMITGFTTDDAINQALRSGAYACLMKPFSLREIVEMVEITELAA